MRAGPYIKSQIESCRRAASLYRADAASLRHRADELDRFAAEHDQMAERWASGTDDGITFEDRNTPVTNFKRT